MTSDSFGNISLADYRKIVHGRRRSMVRRIAWGLATLAICLLCTAAGDYIRPWSGKSSRQLSFSEAIGLLDNASAETWESELALGTLQRHLVNELGRVESLAQREDKLGEYARICLLHATRAGIARIKAIASLEPFRTQQEHSLDILRRDLNP